MPDPILVGRNAEKIEALAQGARHRALDAPTSTPRSPTRTTPIFFDAGTTQMRPTPARQGDRAPASTSTARSRSRRTSTRRWRSPRWPRRRASSTASCRTSCSCPACASSTCCATPASSAACCRCAASSATGCSRATCSRSQRPSWNYRTEDGGGMILDMLCHWRYVLDNLFGEVKSVSCLGATHIPERWDESGQALRGHRRRRRLRHLRARGRRSIAQINISWATRVRRDDLVTFHVDGTHGSAVAGLQDCRHAAARQHAAPGLEPGREADRSTSSTSGRRCRTRRSTTTASRSQWEHVHPPRRRGRALPLDAARRRQGRAARRGGAAELEGAALGRRAGADSIAR